MEVDIVFRWANENDNLEEISELLYLTDPYIYPYWFNGIENCKRELPRLLLEDKFFFNVHNLFLTIDSSINKIIGLICVVDKNVPLDYDYSALENYNERYKFTIDNYIKGLIDEVENADFAYISNVCVSPNYRGRHIGSLLVEHVIEIYKERLFSEISLDVLADNPGAIKVYENMGFNKSSEVFAGFNNPSMERPEVFSMKINLSDKNDS